MNEAPAITLTEAFNRAAYYSDNVDYRLIHLPAAAMTVAASIISELGEPFAALVIDRAEVTLLIPDESIAAFERRLRDHAMVETRYRLITFDVELDSSLVGFLATVSTALADEGISILCYAAYARDHFFVPAERFEEAMRVLHALSTKDET